MSMGSRRSRVGGENVEPVAVNLRIELASETERSDFNDAVEKARKQLGASSRSQALIVLVGAGAATLDADAELRRELRRDVSAHNAARRGK